ncbi:polysaccharide export protein [Novosphingobium sp. HK4-1]|uniref:Polysaccharide export protein n=1 Tax=Novosphingobium mangrovi (ex Huang et al. 2023) TaxID=2976432 RepID=A0ABT2I525_9SPHN|nr:polysaccharide export protein [Novosphingobium mangrovi (ex Huang et al. 2023)]
MCLALSHQSVRAEPGEPSPYRLSPGDRVAITLPLHPELNATGPIGPDGRFSLPMAGQVELGGLTVDEAQGAISAALHEARLVANARPSLAVEKFGGTVFVGGEVRNPGQVELTGPLNPLQAIISAGGLLGTARSKRIAVIRPTVSGPGNVYTMNVRSFVKTGDPQGNIVLHAGDIVFVPKSGIAEVNLWLDQHINGIIPDALHFNVNLGDGNNQTSAIVTP